MCVCVWGGVCGVGGFVCVCLCLGWWGNKNVYVWVRANVELLFLLFFSFSSNVMRKVVLSLIFCKMILVHVN